MLPVYLAQNYNVWVLAHLPHHQHYLAEDSRILQFDLAPNFAIVAKWRDETLDLAPFLSSEYSACLDQRAQRMNFDPCAASAGRTGCKCSGESLVVHWGIRIQIYLILE